MSWKLGRGRSQHVLVKEQERRTSQRRWPRGEGGFDERARKTCWEKEKHARASTACLLWAVLGMWGTWQEMEVGLGQAGAGSPGGGVSISSEGNKVPWTNLGRGGLPFRKVSLVAEGVEDGPEGWAALWGSESGARPCPKMLSRWLREERPRGSHETHGS